MLILVLKQIVVDVLIPTVKQTRVAAELSGFRADVSEVLVPNHAAREYDGVLGARRHAGGLELGQEFLVFAEVDVTQPSGGRVACCLAVDGQVTVRRAVVHNAEQFIPEAARTDRAGLKFIVLAPVGRIPLE